MIPTIASRSPFQLVFVAANAAQDPLDQNENVPMVPRSPTSSSEVQPIVLISESVPAESQESEPRSPTAPSNAQRVAPDFSSLSSSSIDVAHQQQAVPANFSSSDEIQAISAGNNEQEAEPDLAFFVDATDLEELSRTRRESFTPNKMSTLHRFLNTSMPTPSAGFADLGSRMVSQLRYLTKEHANELCQKTYQQTGFDLNRLLGFQEMKFEKLR